MAPPLQSPHLDEVGYFPFDQDAANLLVQLVSSRYERASLIMTSNLPVVRWGDAFGVAIASAMIDRIVHHADVISLKGDSYRLQHHQPIELRHIKNTRRWPCLERRKWP